MAHAVLRQQVVEANQNEVYYGSEHNETSMELSTETNNTEIVEPKVVEQPQLRCSARDRCPSKRYSLNEYVTLTNEGVLKL